MTGVNVCVSVYYMIVQDHPMDAAMRASVGQIAPHPHISGVATLSRAQRPLYSMGVGRGFKTLLF